MLSILIPTYNYVCVKLVTDLQQQAERLECPYEILVADDASEDAFKRENRKINGIPNCKYIERGPFAYPQYLGVPRPI